MKYLIRKILRASSFVLVLFASSLLNAQTQFEENIAPELVEIFLSSQFNDEVQLYADIPVNFPPFTLPQEFEVLGTIQTERESHVFLRTELASDVASFTLSDALLTDGWLTLQEIATRNRPSPIPFVGMITRNNQGGAFCLDNFGVLSAILKDNGQFTVIELQATDASQIPQQLSCEMLRRASEQNQRQEMANRQGTDITPLPQLDIPGVPDPANAPGGFISASSSRGVTQASRGYKFTVDWSIDQVHDFFEEQILEQGWTLETKGVGDTMALSGWKKVAEDNSELSMILNLDHSGGSQFSLGLNLNREFESRGRMQSGRGAITAPPGR